jgi:hypothetical protein
VGVGSGRVRVGELHLLLRRLRQSLDLELVDALARAQQGVQPRRVGVLATPGAEQPHDQVIPRPRERDVEQPHPLGGLHLPLTHVELLPARRCEVLSQSQLDGLGDAVDDDERAAVRRLASQPGEHGDGELEPLRRMDGHDADAGLVVAVATRDRVVGGVAGEPFQVLHRVVERGPPAPRQRSSLLGDEAVAAAGLARPPVVEGRRPEQPRGEHLVDEPRHRHAVALPVQGAQRGERGDDARLARLARPLVRPATPSRPPAHQLDVAAAERRAAQCRHQRHLVGGVVDAAQDVEQVAHLLGGDDE